MGGREGRESGQRKRRNGERDEIGKGS